ncbi:hypothetical protein AMYX_14040 [Anaeromyxobacter diazotrophicus]|uniref:Uncharacterized protein n=1 Tax=Anaeromyxobacter diazotrophicus TaxID=2590199 RepID=A0A7I9VJV9_9BACT|nr:hypothetical protein AMYX_14040 [Anaeromyxobacter diazotrophicus]
MCVSLRFENARTRQVIVVGLPLRATSTLVSLTVTANNASTVEELLAIRLEAATLRHATRGYRAIALA